MTDTPMISTLRARWSIRKFEIREIEKDKVAVLEEALLLCPSSRGINPWRFIFVSDAGTLQKLGRSKIHGSGFLAGAPLAVVITGDTNESDACIEDCSIAAITLQHVSESLGLKSCWCQIRMRPHNTEMSAEEFVRNLLEIPGRYMVECIIGMGYPAESRPPHPREDLDWEKIRRLET